jgi:hypothetical protein
MAMMPLWSGFDTASGEILGFSLPVPGKGRPMGCTGFGVPATEFAPGDHVYALYLGDDQRDGSRRRYRAWDYSRGQVHAHPRLRLGDVVLVKSGDGVLAGAGVGRDREVLADK